MLITTKRFLFIKTVHVILFQSEKEITIFKTALSYYDQEFKLSGYRPSLAAALNNLLHEDGKTYITMDDTEFQRLLPFLFLCFLHIPYVVNGEAADLFVNGVHINSIISSTKLITNHHKDHE